jgi:DNA adenine methylase
VYCDPPYFPLSATANFTAYSGAAFGIAEQRELALLVAGAAAKGVRCVVSNHDLPAVRELYSGAEKFISLSVRRSISCDTAKRSAAAELLIIV